MGFFSNLFQNYRDQGSGSGLQTLLGSSALTGYPRGYDEDRERKWRERFGTGQERTNLDAPQTGLSAAQINLKPGLKGNRVTPGMFGSVIDFMTGKVSQKTNNPVEVAGLGNVVSDPDGSMYGTDSSPALADYMAPQEDVAITKEEIVDIIENQNMSNPKPRGGWLGDRMIVDDFRPKSSQESGKLNENIPGNIYAKHGGSVFRNAYDQASRIMSGGLEGLKESIDINGQPHNLAYINPSEANLLKVLGGSGQKVNGVPAYYFGDEGFSESWDEGPGDDFGAATSYESASPAEQEAADMANIAADDFGAATSLESASPEERAAADAADWVGINQQMTAIAEEKERQERERFRNEAKPINEAYVDDALKRAKMGNIPIGKLTGKQISDMIEDARFSWYAVEGKYGKDMSESEKTNMAIKYAQVADEQGMSATDHVLATGYTYEEWEAINQAKEDKEARTDEIKEELKIGADLYADKPMDLDELMDLNEMYVENEQHDAVRASIAESFNVDVQAIDPMSQFREITAFDPISMYQNYKAGMPGLEQVARAIGGFNLPLGFGAMPAIANYLGKLMGEEVIGSFTKNGVNYNVHESGKVTAQSPEDEPGFDQDTLDAAYSPPIRKGKEILEYYKEPKEEDEKPKGRSIADLVKPGSSGEGLASLKKILAGIYGEDAPYIG